MTGKRSRYFKKNQVETPEKGADKIGAVDEKCFCKYQALAGRFEPPDKIVPPNVIPFDYFFSYLVRALVCTLVINSVIVQYPNKSHAGGEKDGMVLVTSKTKSR